MRPRKSAPHFKIASETAAIVTSLGTLLMSACEASSPSSADVNGSEAHAPRVIYDNDEVIDVYTDDYVMALAGAGRIELIGMVTSSTTEPFNRWVSQEDLRRMREDRATGIAAARAIGITGIPDPVGGPDRHLVPPESGHIGDTEPIGSVGSRLVVETAATLPAGAVLHLVMGGPLTLAADAFLVEPSIADRVVVHWLGGRQDDMADYNGWADPWAAHIVLQRLKLIQYPAWQLGKRGAPSVPKRRLENLPDTPWSSWMVSKQHPTNPLPDERDADAPPAIGLVRPDYVIAQKRVSFGGWSEGTGSSPPLLREDPEGSAVVVLGGDRDAATEEWWRTILAAMAHP